MMGRHAGRIVALWLIGLLTPVSLHAQAWTTAKGTFYAKLSRSDIRAADQFTFDGRTADFIDGVSGNAFVDQSYYLYTEWGLLNNLTVVLSAPFKQLTVTDQAFRYETSAIGSATVGLRFGLFPLLHIRPSAISMALNLGATVPTGYTRNYTPSVGSGQVDAHALLGLGLSFWPTAAYIQAAGGYRYRSTYYGLSKAVGCTSGTDIFCIRDTQPAYGDEWLFQAEGGIILMSGTFFIQALGQGVWSVDKPVVGFTALNPIPTRQRYIKAGAGFTVYPFKLTRVFRLENLGFGVQAFLTPYGRNTIDSQDLFFGIDLRGAWR
ncbi:MAG: hypothetical protein R2834_04685 [Rhodothermales bacterium]